MTPAEFEARARALVGRRVARVRYHEIAYRDADGAPLGAPAWTDAPPFDSLDFGLDLTLDDGAVVHLTWGATFAPYGVAIVRRPLHDVDAVRVWDVSEGSRWAPLLGVPIADVATVWERFELADGSRRTPVPLAVRLAFADGSRVTVAAVEVRGASRTPLADHLTVAFGADADGLLGPPA